MLLLSCGGPEKQNAAPSPTDQTYKDYLAQGTTATKVESLAPPDAESDADAMAVHFIDVGQGAATLLEFPCGAILIDTGGEHNDAFDSEQGLIAFLRDFFERRTDLDRTLDALVISHPHIDHTRSIPAILQNFRVRNVVDNGDVQDDIGGRPQTALHQWIYDHNQEIRKRNNARRQNGGSGIRFEDEIGHYDVSSEDISDKGLSNGIIDPIPSCPASQTDPKIQALWGMRLGRREKGHNANNDSVVLRVDYGKSSALLSGDLELLSIVWMSKHYKDNLAILDTDIYYVPHHGSRNSTGMGWISYVSPKLAVMSVGPYDRHLKTWPEFTARSFGHPNKNTVEHLLDPEHGVSAMREKPVTAMIGLRGAWKETPSEWESRTIRRAIYATGWDGDIAVTAHADGKLEVETSGR
ncbi:MAG: MBL fold metallo-hydrolase [Myxococcales bacterium]|nr:MBL fold metallo-hydrolase [Myxococcales bacterium]